MLGFQARQAGAKIVSNVTKVLRVMGSDSDVRMIFTNLVMNALHAMPDDCTVTVNARREGTEVVIEVDRTLNRVLIDEQARLGYEAQRAKDSAEALAVLAGFRPTLAVFDLRLPDTGGMTFLSELREYCPVIMLTAHESIEKAVQLVRAGAADWLVKPVAGQSLELALKRIFETAALMQDPEFSRRRPAVASKAIRSAAARRSKRSAA